MRGESAFGSDRVCVDEDVRQLPRLRPSRLPSGFPLSFTLRPGKRCRTAYASPTTFWSRCTPISCGKNWGSGSRVPVRDDCVLLDLGQMNRILDFDEELAYVTVEPGVSFGQLFSYLQEHRSNLMMGAPGLHPMPA